MKRKNEKQTAANPKNIKTRRIVTALSAVFFMCVCQGWQSKPWTGLCLAGQQEVYAAVYEAAEAHQGTELVLYTDLDDISKYGNVKLHIDGRRTLNEDWENAGIGYGDIVEVSFLDQTIDVPVVKEFGEAASGDMLIRLEEESSELSVNMGDFASAYLAVKTNHEDGTVTWKYKEGIEGPVEIRISLKEKGGYANGDGQGTFRFTDERSDYPSLTDEEFANFRVVATTGMGENILYRTSSPINPEHKRSAYADAALREAGVVTIMNLVDNRSAAEAFEGYGESYYSTVRTKELNMGMSFDTDDFRSKLADALRFFAENEGPYAIHCQMGKDRTGAVTALVECLMGASYDEVKSDYMITFYNYYGITPDETRYDVIAEENIIKTLQKMFGVDDLKNTDLAKAAEEHIRKIGLNDDEIRMLMANLSGQAAEVAIPFASLETFVPWYAAGAAAAAAAAACVVTLRKRRNSETA